MIDAVTVSDRISAAVENAIRDKVGANTPFTAYDITLAVREAMGQTVDLPHWETKGMVHGLANQMLIGTFGAIYTSTPIQTPSGNAILYHSYSADVDEYVRDTFGDDCVDDGSGGYTPSIAPMTIDADDDNDDNNTQVVDGNPFTDARGRYCISKADMEAHGYLPGDTAWITFAANNLDEIHISKHDGVHAAYKVNANGNVVYADPYKVDKSGNVRFAWHGDTQINIIFE